MFLIVSFSLIVLLSASSDCPPGSAYYDSQGVCLTSNPKISYSFNGSKCLCSNWGGQRVKILNVYDNVFVATQALNQTANLDTIGVWIGVGKGANGTWLYDDGTPLQYQNWGPGYPEENHDSAVLDPKSYKWISIDSTLPYSRYLFVCSVPPAKIQCPKNWLVYRSMCYTAMEECYYSICGGSLFDSNGVLTSIADGEENAFVTQLAVIKDNFCYYSSQYAIGLLCRSTQAPKWQDGTPFQFDRRANGACTDGYGIISNPNCSESSYWNGLIASIEARFTSGICKKNPFSDEVETGSLCTPILPICQNL